MVTSPFRAKLWGLFSSLPEQSFPLIRPRCSCCQGCRWEKLPCEGFGRERDDASPFAGGTMLLLFSPWVFGVLWALGLCRGGHGGHKGRDGFGGGQSCRAAACEPPCCVFKPLLPEMTLPQGMVEQLMSAAGSFLRDLTYVAAFSRGCLHSKFPPSR